MPTFNVRQLDGNLKASETLSEYFEFFSINFPVLCFVTLGLTRSRIALS